MNPFNCKDLCFKRKNKIIVVYNNYYIILYYISKCHSIHKLFVDGNKETHTHTHTKCDSATLLYCRAC